MSEPTEEEASHMLEANRWRMETFGKAAHVVMMAGYYRGRLDALQETRAAFDQLIADEKQACGDAGCGSLATCDVLRVIAERIAEEKGTIT